MLKERNEMIAESIKCLSAVSSVCTFMIAAAFVSAINHAVLQKNR